MTENEKTTALIPSVGADGGQPPHNSTYQSIPHETCESNLPEENIEEMRERIRRMNDPHYLHTVSMTELYQTAYKIQEQTARHRRSALLRGIYPRRSAQNRKIISGSAACLPCQHRAKAVGL